MPVVIDASVAVDLLLRTERASGVAQALRISLLAPQAAWLTLPPQSPPTALGTRS